jgi:hypothetical protein
LDDDYFLAFLVSRDVAGGYAVLDRVRERVTRGLHRPEFPGLKDRLIGASGVTIRIDPDTAQQVMTVGTRPEGDRIRNTTEKQVRGLVYNLTGLTVPRSRFMMTERVWGSPLNSPPGVWEMFVKASV